MPQSAYARLRGDLRLEYVAFNSYISHMKAWNAHFDGKFIVLDEPSSLQPNAKVKVIPADESSDLVGEFTRMSEPVFQKIWDNPLDADYDKL